jgi:hypothetical protein
MDLQKAKASSRLKTNTTETKAPVNMNEEAKKTKAIQEIYTIITDFYKKRTPISNNKLRQIIILAEKNKILLIKDVINCFYEEENRNNVSQVISYFDKRIISFLDSQKLLPPSDDPLFKITVLNICIKIKYNQITFTNDIVVKSKLFSDLGCFLGAIKLYIWNVKVNECAPLNLLQLNELESMYTPEIGRLCKIANAPILNPPKTKNEIEKESEGIEMDSDDDENIRKGGSKSGINDGSDNKGSDENDEKSDESNDESNDESGGKEPESDQTNSENETPKDELNSDEETKVDNVEQFITDNLDFKKYSEEEFLYIIFIAILLTTIFFVFIKYRKI